MNRDKLKDIEKRMSAARLAAYSAARSAANSADSAVYSANSAARKDIVEMIKEVL